MALKSTYI